MAELDTEALLSDFLVAKWTAVADAFVEGAQGRCSRKTGTLADSIQHDAPVFDGDRVTCIVTAGEGLDYAGYQNEGTGIYGPEGAPIVPVNAKVLVFDSAAGGVTFARSVKGAPGTHFWDDTVKDFPNIVASVG